MRKNNFFLSLTLVLLTFCFLTACNKDKEVTPSKEQQDFETAKSTLEIVAEIEDLNNMVMSFQLDGMAAGGRKAAIKESTCGTVSHTYNEATDTETFTTDFGTGVSCGGQIRKGKVIFTASSLSTGLGYTLTAKFDNYEVDGKKLVGDYTVQILSSEDANTLRYVYSFKNAVLTYANGSKVTWNSSHEINWNFSFDENSGDFPLFQMSMSGGLSGINVQGKTFSAAITTPLVIDGTCQYGLTKGTYTLKAEGHSDAVLDFGDGTCDNLTTLTINGKSEKITLED